ncbi:hypothetical protein BG011_006398 [Mortierella polycephala]|uniref:Mif2/CENP-C cupin domain-containing protein n=1 Tax=Mortierella polycephala TaxID=41804 RepID=A0A9P6PVI2_9FUNG|nr:hypothetical protein BG011_006398 [Mortierella polycephala]
MYESSVDEHPSPPLESVKRKIDFSRIKIDDEPVGDYSRVSRLLQAGSYAASNSRQRTHVIQSSDNDTGEKTRTTTSTSTKKSTPDSVLAVTSRLGMPATRSVSTWRTRDFGAATNTPDARGGTATSSHSRNTPASKMFDFEGLDFDNDGCSGPGHDDDDGDDDGDDVYSGPDDNSNYSGLDDDGRSSGQNGDNKDFAPVGGIAQGFPHTEDDGFFMHTPDTPSRPSHSVLVLDTPEIPKQRQRWYDSRDRTAMPERESEISWNKRSERKDVGTFELVSVTPAALKQYQRRNGAQDRTTMPEKKPVIPWNKKLEHIGAGTSEMLPPTSTYQFKDEDPMPRGQKDSNDMEDHEPLIDRRKTNGRVQTKNTARSGTVGTAISRQVRAQATMAPLESVETKDSKSTGNSQPRKRGRPRKVKPDSNQPSTHISVRNNQTETNQSEQRRDRSGDKEKPSQEHRTQQSVPSSSETQLRRTRAATTPKQMEITMTTEITKRRTGTTTKLSNTPGSIDPGPGYKVEKLQRMSWTTAPDKEESGLRRSKRATYKPLEFWKNERVILGKSDGTPLPVPAVKGIIRAVPQEQPNPRGTRRRQGSVQPSTRMADGNASKRHSRKLGPGSDDEEDESESTADSGNLSKQGSNQEVSQKCETIDHVTGRAIHRVLAETKNSEQEQFQDAAGGEYQFYRGLEDDCISTGVVRIPGLGTKPNKNAFVSSMMYYVIQGTVRVTIYNSTIVLCRGGRFLVPKGNQYMIQNLSRTDCLLLFSQSKAAIPYTSLTTNASDQIATSAAARETRSYKREEPVPSSSVGERRNAHRNLRKRKEMQDYEEAVTDDQESKEDTRSRTPAPRRTLRSASKMYAY